MKYLLILLFLTSCATSRNKCIEKYCSQDTVSKTVVIHDTIITEQVTKDTVFSTSVDTVILTKDKLIIKYIRFRDSVYLSGTYEADTIVRTDTVTVSIPVNCPVESDWGRVKSIWWILLLCFGAGLSMGLYLRK
jgi:hypothetical protein